MHRLFQAPAAIGLRYVAAALLAAMLAFAMPAQAAADASKAQTVVHMLDYLGVDYPNFVSGGNVLNESEYAEQLEFATQSGKLLAELPPVEGQQRLLDEAEKLRQMIAGKADGAQVSASAATLRADVIQAYSLSVSPRQAPDLARGASLFAQNCIACHGTQGRGDGPMAKSLEPAPSNFHDEERMRQRSIYGLFNTISLGVGGTGMRAFTELPEADRWALAFYVNSLRHSPEQLAKGEADWKSPSGAKAFASLKDLVTLSPDEAAKIAGEQAPDIQAYLASNPQALTAVAPTPLTVTRNKLEQTLQAYRAGDRPAARELAISAYLEGFELLETSLNNVAPQLRQQVEKEMMGLRAAIAAGKPVDEVAGDIDRIRELLQQTEAKLAGDTLSPATAFVSSLVILLREGLEAILVLAAIIAFIRKTGRRDAIRYIHFGWMLALVLGVLTWVAASYFLTVSGASREMTEGISAILASVMLLYIGYWLHSKSNAQAWQQFLRDKVTAALGQRTLWTMAGISFLAVYREIFETILFYEALWGQVGNDGHGALLGGIAAAAILLALLTWGILKYSVRLPLGRFFSSTSSLMAILAVIFAGNGIKALQEAGVIDSTPVDFVTVPLLGIFPSLQTLGIQAAVIVLIVSAIWMTKRQQQPANTTA